MAHDEPGSTISLTLTRTADKFVEGIPSAEGEDVRRNLVAAFR